MCACTIKRPEETHEEICSQNAIGYVIVAEKAGDQLVEYLLKSNSTVMLSLLEEDFPGITGLKYQSTIALLKLTERNVQFWRFTNLRQIQTPTRIPET